VRVTTLLNKLLRLPGLWVRGIGFTSGAVIVSIEPRFRWLTCPVCGTRVRGRFEQKVRRWRHLAIWGLRVELVGPIRRLRCPSCRKVRTEAVPWARPGSRFTRPFEDVVGFLTQQLNHTAVSELMGISWSTVGQIARRLVAEKLETRRFDGLRRIGVDEISYQRRHKYLTLVVDHDAGHVIWAAEGKNSETLKGFFEQLGPERLTGIEVVSMDLSAAYQKAVREALPDAHIVFDKFHLARLAQQALDEVRRSLVRELPAEQRRPLKRTRWVLLKSPQALDPAQQNKLATIQRTNHSLYRAYLLKESFLDILASLSAEDARAELRAWLAWASRCRLRPFVRLARTVRKHFDGILRMIETRLTNARLEGTNNKVRLLSHRAYGFHSAAPLIATTYLCCSGLSFNAPTPLL
jgi:transposase